MASHRLFTLPVAILVFQSFLLGTSEFIIVGVLPDIASDLNIAVTMVGNLVAIFAFVYAPLTPIGAAICSKFQRFRALIVLLLVFLAGNVICTFAVNYPMLLLARVVTASVSGVLVAVALTFGPDVTSRENQPRYMSWVFSGFSIASVFGMPMGTWIAGLAGWRTSFVVIDVLTVVMIGVMFVVLPKRSVPSQVGILGQFKLFSDRRIILGVLTVVFGLASSYVWYTYLTPMFTNELHVPAAYVSVALVAFGACCLWSNLYSGKLATRGTGIWPLVGMSKAYGIAVRVHAATSLCHGERDAWIGVAGGSGSYDLSAELAFAGAVFICGRNRLSRLRHACLVVELHVLQSRYCARFRSWWRGLRCRRIALARSCRRRVRRIGGTDDGIVESQ